MAWTGVIGDLITGQPRLPKGARGVFNQFCGTVILGQLKVPLALPPGKDGAGLHGEVVDRKMGHVRCQCLKKLLIPVRQALLRQVLDQVKTPAAEISALKGLIQPSTGLKQVMAAMAPAELFENDIIKTLATEADPIDACIKQLNQILAVETGGIHFKGELSPGLNPEMLP